MGENIPGMKGGMWGGVAAPGAPAICGEAGVGGGAVVPGVVAGDGGASEPGLPGKYRDGKVCYISTTQ